MRQKGWTLPTLQSTQTSGSRCIGAPQPSKEHRLGMVGIGTMQLEDVACIVDPELVAATDEAATDEAETDEAETDEAASTRDEAVATRDEAATDEVASTRDDAANRNDDTASS